MSQIGPAEDRHAPDQPSSSLRRQLWWTALFVLIALGGAGLASAADRPPTDDARPELSWRAEQAARPMLDELAAQLAALEEELAALSSAVRDTLVGLRALDPAGIETALAAGDASARRLDELVATLVALRQQQAATVDDRRLSNASQELLAGTDAAIEGSAPLPTRWGQMAFDAQRVARLLDALARHDELVFRATTAARQERFDEALGLLGEAELTLLEAEAIRDELEEEVDDVQTLDELLRRYRDYDVALTALYLEMAGNGTTDDEQIRDLIDAVDLAQAALAASNDALDVVVAKAGGRAVTDTLVLIEEARGAVSAALAVTPAADER